VSAQAKKNVRFGVLFSGAFPLMRAIDGSVLADKLGYDSAWFGEDYFYWGGIATGTAVAERTENLSIGLGILTPLTRHPALTVMETAALDHISNGRLVMGYGAGVRYWMSQMKLDYSSPMTAMREAVDASRRLYQGETISSDGRFYSFDNVKLNFDVYRSDPPIYLGVEGPKMLTLSGEIADGTVLSVLASPGYIAWAWERVREGCAISGRDPAQHKMVVYVIFAMDDDGAAAKDAVRTTIAEYLGAGGRPVPISIHGGVPDETMIEMGRIYREGRFPTELVTDEIVRGCSIAGTPDECKASIQAMIDAGADEIVFIPFPPEKTEESVERIAKELLPVFR
jgi:alkanesulfonate monooxygenase SsuD/methylene tetrahydromethanopterin reductase-like flavin-dependent oxidoreductase (luciferase family)